MPEPLKMYAIVELFGHVTVAGLVTEETIAGSAMVRVDVPATDNSEAYTKFYGSAAIYAITPVVEAVATRAAQNLQSLPVTPWLVREQVRPALIDSLGDTDDEHNDYQDDSLE